MQGGTQFTGHRQRVKVGRFIIYSPYKIRDPFLPIIDPNEQVWMKNWEEVIEEIRTAHGNKPRVAVFPNAEVQLPPESIQ